ncbi:MAG: CoA-binding protein [Chloroflexota bacterium]
MEPLPAPVATPALEYLFHPRAIAVAGVSTDLKKINPGRLFLEALRDFGYEGKLYPLNPNGGEVAGLKCYTSLKEIPDCVDYVISAIPARYTPQLILDGAAKGVRTIHMFTAGFTETGEEEGRQLERQIAALARSTGVRIIGPNCMGLYCPQTRLTFNLGMARKGGSIGYVVQSGGNAIYGIREAESRGVYFSKVISYGNAIDLNECDFLEYLGEDPDTKIIGAYVEGVRDGRRFLEVLKKVARVKPVIIYKGGVTESGMRTAASHTGSLGGQERVWGSLIRQAGAIQVDSVDELVDLLLLFTFMAPPKGNRVAILGSGGGVSVHAADAAAKAGLVLPPFPEEIRQRLKQIFGSAAGSIFTNPLDMYAFFKHELIQETIKVFAQSPQFDIIMVQIAFDIYVPVTPELHTYIPFVQSVINLREEINRRSVVVLHFITSDKSKQIAHHAQERLSQSGFAIFPSVSRASLALSRFLDYHRRAR